MASTSTARPRTPQSLSADDKMALRAAELAAWAQRNVRTILTVATVLLVAAIAAFVMRWSSQRKADQAAAQWIQLQDAVAQGPAGIQRLSNFANSYAGTAEAAEARLALAGLYLDQNQAPKAIEEARKVADAGGPLAFQGWMMLGAAQAKAGQRDQAIQTYQRAADETDMLYQQLEARSEAALLHEEGGNFAAAAELYRAMMAETEEGTVDRSIMELRAAEASAKAAAARR